MRALPPTLMALAACGYSHTVARSAASGSPAAALSPLPAVLLYAGTDAREASPDQGGNVWIATASGVLVLPADGGAAVGYDGDAGLPDDDVRCVTGGVAGQALVGFGTQLQYGVPQIDLLTLSGASVSGAPKIFNLTGEIVEANHIAYDAARRQYWIGTNEGVSMLSAAGDAIEHRHPVHPHGATLGLAVTPAGDVWDGDQFQLSRLNAGPGDFDATFDPVLQPWVQSGQDISAVLVDGAGDIWAGSLDRGLAELAPATFTVQLWTLAAGLPSLSVQALALDGDGTIWVATDSGLGRLDPSSGSWTLFRAPPAAPASALPSDDVIDVTIDASQIPRRVIVTTSQGVVAYDGN
ncbi:MAG: ligand-binding sensor domain-containing protein [Myxococcales bacterium]